jgi:alpha-mannosidase
MEMFPESQSLFRMTEAPVPGLPGCVKGHFFIHLGNTPSSALRSFMIRIAIVVASIIMMFVRPEVRAGQPVGRTTSNVVVNGFAGGITGEHINYHSFHPYAAPALLTRCLDGKRVISWKTDPAPPTTKRETVSFRWIAAHSTGSSVADARFHLSVNGKRRCTFSTVKDRRVMHWSLPLEGGGILTFDGQWEDAAHDLFGYMILTLPKRELTRGEPVTVSVVGDSLATRDWYMTFTYAMRESLAVQPQPALLRTSGGPRQLVDVLISTVDSGAHIEIAAPHQKTVKAALSLGFNRIQVPVSCVSDTQRIPLVIRQAGHGTRTEHVLLRPVSYREFWLLPHSHNDIGYSDLQADVEKKQIKNLRDAVRLFKQTAGYPKEAQFKWNTEILWAVDSYLAQCSPAERDEFIDVVKHEGIGLNATYSNQLTGICRPEELLRLTDFARHLRNAYGVKINDAMITDIPGYTWATVTALAQGGIKYFSSGPNYMPQLPDGGDRVGHFNRAWGDRPCYWVSPSGQEKVLFWTAGRGYSWFAAWLAGKVGPNTAARLFDYVRELDERNYPYDMVHVRYTIVGDNGPTDPELPGFVKMWNEQYASPKLIIATASTMFEEFERRWGQSLPTFAGDITPYWEDGAISTLRELGMARMASERLVQAEAAECIAGSGPLAPARFDQAWRNVHLFDEHTWGAHNSVNDPDNPFAVSQWQVKQAYAVDLDRQSKELLRDALASGPTADAVDVVNTSSWPRTDLVLLSREQSAHGENVVDAAGQHIPSQRLSTGELAFVARSVPPLGMSRFRIQPGKASGSGAVHAEGVTIANDSVVARIDPASGAVRSLRTADGREFVDTTARFQLNQFLYVPGKNPENVQTPARPRIEVIERGPVVGVIRITSDAPGCKSLVQEVRVVDGITRVDLVSTMDRKKIREKEAVHIAFPLSVAGGATRCDGGWGIVRPGADQLPGSCMDYISSGRWLDVSYQASGVTWTMLESPLVEIGAMTDETPAANGYRPWRTSLASGAGFYSYVMNNYWHTNFAADQEGIASIHYALHPHREFDAAEAYKRGVELNQPLLVRSAPAAANSPNPLLTVDAPGVVVTSVKRSADGKGVMVRLFNATERSVEFTVDWKGLQPARTFVSSPEEVETAEAGSRLSLPAFGVLTMKCVK